uniref:Uncharacterized protein n=1 Tax=Ditylenchus dipsaci TaxID=166011 RepID=A0A915DW22_9BILA
MTEVSKLQGSKCSFEQAEEYFKSVKPLDWLNDQIEGAELGAKPWQLVLFLLNPLIAKLCHAITKCLKLRDMVKAGQLVVMRDVQPVKYENGVYRLSNSEGLDFQTKFLFNAMALDTRLPMCLCMLI